MTPGHNIPQILVCRGALVPVPVVLSLLCLLARRDIDGTAKMVSSAGIPTDSIAFKLRSIYKANIYSKPHPSPHLAGKHRRARHSVRLRLIRIIRNPRITPLVRARERNKPRRRLTPTPGNLQLMAPRVELGAGIRVRGVQGDDLVAHEVVARRNALRDCVGHHAAGFHQRCRAPGVGRAGAACLLDFEPHGAVRVSGCVGEGERDGPAVGHVGVAARVGAFGHVCHGGTDVGVGPEGPVKVDLGAGSDFGVECSGLGAWAGLASAWRLCSR